MAGRRTIRNRLSRASKKDPQQTKSDKSSSNYRKIATTSIITILIGAVFGDLIVKKNIQAYIAERSAFEHSPAAGDAAFKEAHATYDTRLRERRRHTQRIIKYIADDSISAFDDYYETYDKALTDWNKNHDRMAKSILSATSCTKRNETSDQRNAIAKPLFKRFLDTGIFVNFLTEKPGIAEITQSKFVAEKRFCPTFFLTKSSGYSAHSVFSSMHKKIYQYRNNNYNECRLRHRQNIDSYYQTCITLENPTDRSDCMREFDKNVEQGAFCDANGFDLSKYKVRDVEFNEFDFYWGLGDQFFRSFREEFILDYCNSKIDFWGTALDWDCGRIVAEYLAKD